MLKDHYPTCENRVPLENTILTFLAVFDVLPCAAVFWSARYAECVLNREARQLTGFSSSDLHSPSSWMNRIHIGDRARVSAARERVLGGERRVLCDYRFSPKGRTTRIWLREISCPYLTAQGEVEGILSIYTDISDLKKKYRIKNRETEKIVDSGDISGDIKEGIIEEFVHAAQNSLQGISMGLDILRITYGESLESETIFRGVERCSRLLREIREYFSPPVTRLSTEHLQTVLQETVQNVEKRWYQRGRCVRAVYDPSLPALRLDWRQFRDALERVLDFACAILPQEGEVVVEAELKEIAFQRYIEIKITIPCTPPVEEGEILQPFLRVNGYEVGLSLVLVREMLQRNNGQLTFCKDSQKHGLLTLFLKAH